MRSILQGNKNFQNFSDCCQKKSRIEKELDDPKTTERRKKNLEKRLNYLEAEISELELKLQDRIKVS